MRAFVAQSRMSSFSIVEDFDVVKQTDFSLFMGLVLFSIDQLLLESGKEALYRGIVPAITFATHARCDAPLDQLLLIRASCILAASITVKEQ